MDLPYDNFMKESLPSEKRKFLIESEDLYPYIKGERKEIIFVNSTNVSKIVKIPISLRKNDIYAIAEKYKSSEYYEIIQLNHNNKKLENDDSSIDCILNGDSIKIIEFLDCDTSYIDSLLLKHKNSPIIHNIKFNTTTGHIFPLHLPNDITGFEMKKAFCAKMKIPFKFINKFSFIYNAYQIKDNAILENIFNISKEPHVVVSENCSLLACISQCPIEGKRIHASIYLNDKQPEFYKSFCVGTLTQIKEFFFVMRMNNEYLGLCLLGNGLFYGKIGEIEVKENDERSFSEIGIREDFICKLKVKKIKKN
jgi:hypothetical protein